MAETLSLDEYTRTERGQQLLEFEQEARARRRPKDVDLSWPVLDAVEAIDAAASWLECGENDPMRGALANRLRRCVDLLLDVSADCAARRTEELVRDIMADYRSRPEASAPAPEEKHDG